MLTTAACTLCCVNSIHPTTYVMACSMRGVWVEMRAGRVHQVANKCVFGCSPPPLGLCTDIAHMSTQVMETRVYEGIGISTRQARQRAAALALRKLREFVPGMM